MDVKALKLNDEGYPEVLRQLHQPPATLYYLGSRPAEWLAKPKVAIVGSRRASGYGRAITTKLAEALARRGVVIISGLALGIDAEAHRAALAGQGITVAVLPTSLDNIYPASHFQLAQQIIKSGGTLLSEYPSGAIPFKQNFIVRNRIVAGLADVLLITEAAVTSGTMHTARFALEQGITVMAVPGNITSPGSEGCNNLIKSGAVPVTDVADVCFALGIKDEPVEIADDPHISRSEQRILQLLKDGVVDQEQLALAAKLDAPSLSSALTMLELAGKIRPLGGGNWSLG